MVIESSWRKMKQHVFEAFARDGSISAFELGQIIDIGCVDGDFDEQEKIALINIISKLTRANMSDAMWAKIDKLIHKFELGHDSEASIEHLEDEQDEPH